MVIPPFRVVRVVVVASLVLVAAPTAAFACDPGRPHDGGDWNGGRERDLSSGNAWSWIKADIDVQDPFVITSLGTFSSSYPWVMMSSTSHRDHWAQIGPYKDGVNTGRWDLWQCANGNGAPTNELWSGHSVGSRPTYKVVYGAGGDKYFYVNGTSKSSCSYTFSPDAAIVRAKFTTKALKSLVT